MENNTFFATVTENNILNIDGSAVSDSVKFIKIRFSFPATWDGFAKTVVFKNGDTKCSVILDEKSELCIDEDECYIPHEVIKTPMLSFAVFGIFEDSKATSSWAAIRIIKGCGENGDAPLDPTPTEYEQLLKISEETKKIAQSVRDDADNGAFKGEKGDTGAKGETGATGAKGAPGAKGDKGDKGDAFTYGDFTAEQLAELKGAKGDKGEKGDKGDTGDVNTLQMNTACANALKGNATGQAVRLPDASPNEHTLGVKVNRHNLYDITSVLDTNNWVYYQNNYYNYHITGLKPNTKYTFSMSANNWAGVANNGFYVAINNIQSRRNEDYSIVHDNGSAGYCSTSRTITSSNNGDLYLAFYNVTAERLTTCFNGLIDVQLEKGNARTTYEPFISDLTSVTVTECGKNILEYPYVETTLTRNGLTFTDNKDGTITVNGTATADTQFRLQDTVVYPNNSNPFNSLIGKKVYISGSPEGSSKDTYAIQWIAAGVYGNGVMTITKSSYYRFAIFVKSGITVENLVFKPQIELGTTATSYEPYQEQTYTPAADGTVSGVKSLYPITTLMTDTKGVIIDTEYNKDINKAFAELQQAIISLGGNV